jgi:hypothetical protein
LESYEALICCGLVRSQDPAVFDGRHNESFAVLAAPRASVGKAAYAYAEKHVGPREKVGNKGGTLGNRLRALMAGKP